LQFALPVTTVIVQGWSGRSSRSGTAVTVTDAGWNGALAVGASTGVGFPASTTAPAPDPTAFTVNGTTCG
jgi:cellulose 1,4-beta-cellobiosidase